MGKKSLVARPLEDSDFIRWDELVDRYGTIFQSIRWTKIFEPGIRRIGIYEKGGRLVGGFCIFEQKFFGLRIFRNPPFTPNIGPFYEKKAKNPVSKINEQRRVIQAILEYIEKQHPVLVFLSLAPNVLDALPFYWAEYKIYVAYTYRLNLKKIDDVKKNMSPERRNDIARAIRDMLKVQEEKETDNIKHLVQMSFERQRKGYPREFMKKILEYFSPGHNSYLIVTYKNSIPIAAVYFVHDSRIAYNLLAGYDHKNAHHGAGPLAMYNGILKAKELGIEILDFEGSMIPAVEKYYRSFGGELTPYIRLTKAWLPFEITLKLWKRKLF